jgi:hypothetical protein
MELKIFQINCVANSGINTPQMVNYRHIGLFKKTTESKGVCVSEQFYEFFENGIYSNLVVQEIYTYIQQAPFYIGKRTDVYWYNLDDSIGDSNGFTYMFTNNEIINFGTSKRSNVLANAKLYAFQVLGQNAYSLLDYCEFEISVYIQGNTPPIIAKVLQSVGVVTGMTQPIADNINAILLDL